MPLPLNASAGTRHPMRGLLHRMLRRPRTAPAAPGEETFVQPLRRAGVDPDTRTYWARDDADATADNRSRITALLDAHERGVAGGRPRGNPAFSEALFVELMRARQYRRAFEQLSGECRRLWGTADAFAAAQGTALRSLAGVRVKDVRFLPEWTDSHAGRSYRDVAELDVEYTLSGGDAHAVLPRVVHLVPDDGQWRSLCYPS